MSPQVKYTTEHRLVPWSKLKINTALFGFRDPADYSDKAVEPIAENIAIHGQLTPSLVRDVVDWYEVLDGGRRYWGTGLNIRKQIAGFTEERLVPCQVIIGAASDRELVGAAATSNIARQAFNSLDRLRATVLLQKTGMPKSEIATCLGVSESTVDRDLLVAQTDWMMAHVQAHAIGQTDAANLLAIAKKAERLDDFRRILGAWIEETKQEIEAENRIRQAADDDPLTGTALWPQKRLTRDQVEAWGDAMKTQKEFAAATFKYRAQLKREKGVRRIEIDKLSTDVEVMTFRDTAKVYYRLVNLVDALRPIVKEKSEQEQKQTDSVMPTRMGLAALRELGLDELAEELKSGDQAELGSPGEPDPGFGQPAARDEVDALAEEEQ